MSHPDVSVLDGEDLPSARLVAGCLHDEARSILDAVTEGVHFVGLDGRILFANPSSACMLGYEVEELVGRAAHRTLHHHRSDGSPQAPEECPIYHTMRDGKVRRVRNDTLWRKDGVPLIVDYTATPARDEEGRLAGAAVAFRDASERARAEAELRGSEERFRSMAEAIPQLVWMTDVDGYHTYFNSRWYDFTGLTPEESMGHEWAMAFHPDDRARARKRWAEATASGEPYEIEYRLRDASGEYRWVLGRAHPLRQPDCTIQGWIGTCTNIDELKQALDAAEASEAARRLAMDQLEHEQVRLKEIIEQSPNFMVVFRGPDHVFELVNDALRDLVGRRDLVGKTLAEALPELEGQGFRELLDRVLETGETMEFHGVQVLFQRDPDGDPEPRYLDQVYQPLVEPDGRRSGVIVQGTDVTERHEAEEHVRFQARLLDAVGEAVIATDREGRVLYWNHAAETLFGWTAAEAVGRSIVELTPAEQSVTEAGEIIALLQTGDSWTGEFTVRRKDGRSFPAYVTNTPLHDADGTFVGIVGVSSDLTARKELEERLLQSQKLEAVGRMAGGISHDFNNVLTAIRGNAELLGLELQENGAALQSVKEIQSATARASNLTRQLLAFSRQQVLQPKVLAVSDVVTDMKGMLRSLLREDIELSVSASEVGRVRADPTQLSQVILNLAVNARDAMPGGGNLTICVTDAEVTPHPSDTSGPDPSGRYVRISVADTGVGMDAETRSRIWEPFFTTKADGEGTGLGLPTVYGIVTQSGGMVTVESEPGRGSTFHVHLPAVAGGSTTEAVPDDPSPGGLRSGTGTVLVCDDEESVRRVVARILERAGYAVREAASGAQALALAEEADQPFDLLVTDVVMPGIGGRELIERVRERWPETKVVVMSGYAGDDLRSEGAFEIDAPFLAKPFAATDLLEMVGGLLDEG